MRGESMKDKSKKSTYSTTFGVDPKFLPTNTKNAKSEDFAFFITSSEREGFEPPGPLRAHLISSQVRSTTLTPLLRIIPHRLHIDTFASIFFFGFRENLGLFPTTTIPPPAAPTQCVISQPILSYIGCFLRIIFLIFSASSFAMSA